MRTAMQRVLLVGLLSHAAAFATFFVVLSGTIDGGTKQAPLFLILSLALALIALRNGRHEAQEMRRLTILQGGIVLALGLVGVVVVGAEHPFYPMVLLAVFGVMQLLRMVHMLVDQAYLRQGLLDSYGLDVKVLIGLALLAWFFQSDPSWQTKMVPFFIGFLLLRMYAMSMASRLLKGAKQGSSRLERVQGNLPLLFLIGAGFAMWLLSAFGVPVFHLLTKLVSWMLTPLFYALGFLVEWIMGFINPEHIGETQNMLQKMADRYKNVTSPQNRIDAANHYQSLGAWFPYLLIATVAVIVLWQYYKRKERDLKARVPAEVQEVREFIRSEKAKKPSRPAFSASGALTQMRKTYRKFLLGMQKAGHVRKPGETPLDLAGRIAAASPDATASLQELTDYYMRERYGKKPVDDKQARADQLADELISRDKRKQ